jgi:predicted DCC family thiol-disulfide oxidoreductase YuxK
MQYLVFYDGVCGLCNWSVRWLIRRDRHKVLRYASLQSDLAREKLSGTDLDLSRGTIVYFENDRIFTRSTAVIRILKRLKGIYRLSALLYIIPAPIRDSVYDWVSRNRYKWFGKYDSCPLPEPGQEELFIDL